APRRQTARRPEAVATAPGRPGLLAGRERHGGRRAGRADAAAPGAGGGRAGAGDGAGVPGGPARPDRHRSEPGVPMSTRPLATQLLLQGGRLLLEYNESTGAIHRALQATAKALTDEPCHIAVSYRGVTVAMAGEGPVLEPVGELRYNTAVQARVRVIL